MNLFTSNYSVRFVFALFAATFVTILGYNSINTANPSEANNLPFQNVTNTNLKSVNLGNNSMDGQVIDIDKDGDLDMIIAMEFRSNVILINDGKGNLNEVVEDLRQHS